MFTKSNPIRLALLHCKVWSGQKLVVAQTQVWFSRWWDFFVVDVTIVKTLILSVPCQLLMLWKYFTVNMAAQSINNATNQWPWPETPSWTVKRTKLLWWCHLAGAKELDGICKKFCRFYWPKKKVNQPPF